MDSDFFDKLEYDKHNATVERKVCNAFINVNPNCKVETKKNRLFTTLDMFPTILLVLMFKLKGID